MKLRRNLNETEGNTLINWLIVLDLELYQMKEDSDDETFKVPD